ncbi:MAG: alanyl-tRNA synthetase [Gammaproteobacteria bacterium]|nr:alanyl-tRNA synthetase [Gammaproteobacteria bacterium]
MKTDSNTIRRQFLEYFREHGHSVVSGSPLIPANDPTLLFTNAGMVQFKDVFLGQDQRPYKRAATSQCCVRAGGKHNDLENVGYTARHHTFFEMLGNFSFGDYFKREAIQYAWDFLTGRLGIPAERLWITVYEDDDEAAAIWLNEIGIDKQRFSRCGETDNFWSMGDTGPCGPCTEIFYDHGAQIRGGPPGSADADADRYVEIWNLVFMQYDRDALSNLKPLPNPSVDTGMGLERIAAVVQGVHSNYDTDIFKHIIQAIRTVAGKQQFDAVAARVIADHIRSCAFLIADGVIPANEGRGYVLRRIIRRAIRHGGKLGLHEPFFFRLVEPLIAVMGEAYPHLRQAQEFVERTLRLEEERFGETLDQGLRHLENAITGMSGKTIPGADVFRLYDTYGFPADLTADIARERGLALDLRGFEQAMEAQRERARAASKFEMKLPDGNTALEGYSSEFKGYEQLELETVATGIFADGRQCNELHQDQEGGIILAATPFYAESGGQIGDQGQLLAAGMLFAVSDTRKQGQAHIHLGKVLQGTISTGQQLTARVHGANRLHTMRNHSATHLLHAALRQTLGTHVTQKGSLVAPDRLRFDFSHPEPLTREQLARIEDQVNAKVIENLDTQVAVLPLEQAKKTGAMSLFGEKYAEMVRVLTIGGDFSVELCGGTHVRRAGDIGLFKIVSETGIAAGVRRIEAVTGAGALDRVAQTERLLEQTAQLLKTSRDNILVKLTQQLEQIRSLEKAGEQLQSRLAASAGADMVSAAMDIGGIKVLASMLEGADPKALRETLDQLKNKLGSAVLVLATVKDGKVSLVAGVTRDCTDRIKAGELVNFVAQQVGGKGGGRPDMAQAGGDNPAALPQALASVPDWIRQRL